MKASNTIRPRWMLLLLIAATSALAQQRYSARGIVLHADPSHHTMRVSCDEIHDVMEGMIMDIAVPDSKSLTSIRRGDAISFDFVINKDSSYAEDVRIRPYDSANREPSKVRRLQALDEALHGPAHTLPIGQPVPDFTLTDQQKRSVHFHDFAGKVVALNFIYTRCILPEYCVRSSNNLGELQKQFHDRLGRDLILLSITFDPIHDQPETLREYSSRWKANPDYWRFLTGSSLDIQRVCDLFGVNFIPEEGLFVHPLRTAIIGRDGKLVANLEGNEFSAKQLADLVQATLDTTK